MIVVQLQCKTLGLSVIEKSGTIILGIAEDGTMIEMRQHLLPLVSMFVIVADGFEEDAVVGVIDVILVMRLRFE